MSKFLKSNSESVNKFTKDIEIVYVSNTYDCHKDCSLVEFANGLSIVIDTEDIEER